MARVWHNCGNRSVALRATVLAAGMLLGCTGVAGAFACNPCVTLDNSIVGTGTLGVSGLNTTIPSSLGALRGANLFHSFALFNVPTGGMATFTRSTTTPQNTVFHRNPIYPFGLSVFTASRPTIAGSRCRKCF